MIINALYIINNDVDAHAPNPQGGTPEEELENNDLNVQYFQSVPPWGLAGKRQSKPSISYNFRNKNISCNIQQHPLSISPSQSLNKCRANNSPIRMAASNIKRLSIRNTKAY